MLFASTAETVTHVRDGRVRVLGVGTPQRVPELPDSPPFGDLVPGYVMTNWYALFGQRALLESIVARVQAELPKAREDPILKEKAAAVGMTMALAPADVLRARIEVEVPRWKQLIPQIGLKVQ
jgi:tripartite-type tricarboxylate transporter receptor subunit TctC